MLCSLFVVISLGHLSDYCGFQQCTAKNTHCSGDFKLFSCLKHSFIITTQQYIIHIIQFQVSMDTICEQPRRQWHIHIQERFRANSPPGIQFTALHWGTKKCRNTFKPFWPSREGHFRPIPVMAIDTQRCDSAVQMATVGSQCCPGSGDPHILPEPGRSHTFGGAGEYILSFIIIQIRFNICVFFSLILT